MFYTLSTWDATAVKIHFSVTYADIAVGTDMISVAISLVGSTRWQVESWGRSATANVEGSYAHLKSNRRNLETICLPHFLPFLVIHEEAILFGFFFWP